ncbi:hypothetical protein [Peribacillus alkalitolerans]|uniref:hypothetical protein n=1 Tax=Peribacillus alkalitolerans TaxID=1550385 RepID=UPI0013D6ACB6|nr:hypothetical protein [Peribacillus alkalitolerans]
MSAPSVTSFIVRFHLASMEPESGQKKWRIKVTHVQDETEMTFENIEEVSLFLQDWMQSNDVMDKV